jgi:hypothetical protein
MRIAAFPYSDVLINARHRLRLASLVAAMEFTNPTATFNVTV